MSTIGRLVKGHQVDGLVTVLDALPREMINDRVELGEGHSDGVRSSNQVKSNVYREWEGVDRSVTSVDLLNEHHKRMCSMVRKVHFFYRKTLSACLNPLVLVR